MSDHKPKHQELADRLGQPEDKKRGYAELWKKMAEDKLPPTETLAFLEKQVREQTSNLEEFAEARASHEFKGVDTHRNP